MRARERVVFPLAFMALAAVLSACGGGGGSSGGGSLPPAGGSGGSGGTSTATPSASPTATPTPVASPQAQGRLVDDSTGAAIAGATVVISTTQYNGATPPPGPVPESTTAPNGTFTVSGIPPSTNTIDWSYYGAGYPTYQNAEYVDVFGTDGHAAYHGVFSVAPTGTTQIGTIQIAMPSATDNAWLAGINNDRANIGVPAVTTPLIFDSIMLEAARRWAGYMATNGWYAHACPTSGSYAPCEGTWLWETLNHGIPTAENIGYADPSWSDFESQVMAEKANCPNGNWQTCTYSESTGHYINEMSATMWAGVGSALGEDPSTHTGSNTPYYDTEFH